MTPGKPHVPHLARQSQRTRSNRSLKQHCNTVQILCCGDNVFSPMECVEHQHAHKSSLQFFWRTTSLSPPPDNFANNAAQPSLIMFTWKWAGDADTLDARSVILRTVRHPVPDYSFKPADWIFLRTHWDNKHEGVRSIGPLSGLGKMFYQVLGTPMD